MSKKGHRLHSMQIRREGQLTLTVRGDNHCGAKSHVYGPNRDKLSVRYIASVECEPALDERGFLFDQLMVDELLKEISIKPSHWSCEVTAQRMAMKLIKRLKTDVPTCKVTSLTLSLSPEPYMAAVTVNYRSE